MKQRDNIFDRLASLEEDSQTLDSSHSAMARKSMAAETDAPECPIAFDSAQLSDDPSKEADQATSTLCDHRRKKNSRPDLEQRRKKRLGKGRKQAAEDTSVISVDDASELQEAKATDDHLAPRSGALIASGNIAKEINTMNDPKQNRQTKNIFESTILDATDEKLTDTEKEVSPPNDAPEEIQSPNPRVVNQKKSLLGAPDIRRERLAEGETLFHPEIEEIDMRGEADSSVDPSRLLGRLKSFNWILVSFFTIIVAAFLLIALSQTATLAREVGYLPYPGNWIGFVSLGVLWLAIGVATWQLVVGIVRLKKTPGVSLSALKAMQERQEGRKWSRDNKKVAEIAVREFLRDYPSDRRQRKLLENAGFGQDSITVDELFERVKLQLQIDNGLPDQWLEDVRSRIVLPMDDAASRVINRVSLQVGAATAISPRGSVDSLIVIAQSYRLINELCQLYGVRPGGMETCYILVQSFVSVAIAAGGDQAADKVEEQLRETLQNALGVVAGSIAAKVGARIGEGTVNAMFVRRIGHRLKKHLCPIND
jgi:uncharacterized membrane protein YcjF (UPF0283 family)